MRKYWVELHSTSTPSITEVDVAKETGQRVYFDTKSAKSILGRCYYTPSWQYKDGTRIFDTLKEAYENCALTFANMIHDRQSEIKELESMTEDMRLRIEDLNLMNSGPLVPEPERDSEMGTEIDAAQEDKNLNVDRKEEMGFPPPKE